MSDDSVKMVLVHLLSDILDELLVGRDDPLVHVVGFAGEYGHAIALIEHKVLSSSLLPSGDVLDQESVSVEPGQEDFSDDTVDAFFSELEGFGAHDRGVAEVKTNGISSVVVSDQARVGVVLLRLGHFGAIFGEHNSVDNQILERGAVLNSCGDDHERVEPSSGLIESLSNKVGGETLCELFIFGGERIVALGKWHGSTFKPAVKDFGDPSQDTLALLRGDGDFINIFLVEVSDLDTG